MRNYVLTAALLAGTLAAPAFAQSTSPFTGFRLEGLAGYDALKSGDRDDDGIDTGEDEGDETINGAIFGVGAGYDFDFGGVVAGVEGEFTESTGEQESDETIDAPFRSSIETGRDLYVGGRVGFQAAPSTLLYAKAGYTNLSLEGKFEEGSERFEFDTNADGYRLGAGVEQLFGPNAFGKLEYRYSNYNNLDFSDDFDFDDLEAENRETNIDLDRHQVVVGVGFRF